jgi:hypothetical protein
MTSVNSDTSAPPFDEAYAKVNLVERSRSKTTSEAGCLDRQPSIRLSAG